MLDMVITCHGLLCDCTAWVLADAMNVFWLAQNWLYMDCAEQPDVSLLYLSHDWNEICHTLMTPDTLGTLSEGGHIESRNQDMDTYKSTNLQLIWVYLMTCANLESCWALQLCSC